MSNTNTCRREEPALCQPDRTILAEAKKEAPAAPPEKMEMSEKQFLRDHSLYSAMSSWLFAIAGATNIGVLGVVSSKILMAAEQGRPLFRSKDPNIAPVMGNKTYNRMALAMVAFGGVCMCISNWLESKKVVTEWQLGAGKLKRKTNIVEHTQKVITNQTPHDSVIAHQSDLEAATEQPRAKNWAASVQKNADMLEQSAVRG